VGMCMSMRESFEPSDNSTTEYAWLWNTTIASSMWPAVSFSFQRANRKAAQGHFKLALIWRETRWRGES